MPSGSDPLALDAEVMRQLGYRTVDLLVDRLTDPSIPPLRRASPDEMQARLGGAPPEDGEPLEAILRRLSEDVLPFMSRVDHPRFLAFIPGSGTWPGALGDFIASACNIYAGSWMEASGPSQVELDVVRWFSDWIGYPAGSSGVLVTGGSAANMSALACARESLVGAMRDDLVAYVSDQGHSSVARGARLLGFRPQQVRVIPTDGRFRLRPDVLAAAIDADVAAGRRPLFVSASAGSTNTGAVDPLAAIAEVCRTRGVWLHADAAYGGFAVLTERGRASLEGIELADSVTLDPHKWLYQPFECGCLLVRDGPRLRASFEITPDYLKDAAVADREVNFADLGLQLTRAARALKVWISIRFFGLAAFRAAIDRSLDLADEARRRIESSPNLELLVEPSLGIVCFRRRFEGASEDELDRLNASLLASLEASGVALASSTRLRGRYALRFCILNHTTSRDDIARALDFLEHAEPSHVDESVTAGAYERHEDVRRTYLKSPEREPRAPSSLFDELDDTALERVFAMAGRREAEPGETIVRQWDTCRDFYVILEGEVDVVIDDERVATLGKGDFFGELAALDWAAGFSYPRLASVVAKTPARLLLFPDGGLNELVGQFPTIDRIIRRAVGERLPYQ